jgi:hypothetical protein
MSNHTNNNNPVSEFGVMQSLPPLAPPTIHPAPPTAASPYQPAAGFQESALQYSFHRWLMLGVILLLASVIFVEVVDMWGAPSPVDYDMEAEGMALKMAEDTEAHTDLTRVISSIASIMQAFGLGLIGYALLREYHDGTHEHTALRITAAIVGILVLANIISWDISLF